MRKQTKLWTTQDGTKIRICDMDDCHLGYTIKLLQRMAKQQEMNAISVGYDVLSMLQGEMAIDSVERELHVLETYGLDPSNMNELYDNLILEQERRKSMEEERKEGTKEVHDKNYEEEKTSWEFFIAGVQHHEMHRVIDKLQVGEFLQLTQEPTNKYDANAIRIEHVSDTQFPSDTTVMLGYVPGKISAAVTEVVGRPGKITSCQITEFNAEEKPWKQCKVIIKKED